ncbi:TMEM165/GDT1 family protein [uncultured Mitsuokella sp.]|jgi:Ca2+/H+ antiporter, TMEM165/GDT1 family|uniref:TMEM165/GDT1 family protein n=1 Tax=uncultured Mitsuokella sp. TaxID=453120 RepID=UPI0025DE8868|nr:TMEM165/GDT1 family protein [uncultured Mitsuokella sp.]
MEAFWASFLVVFLAELGDKTQLIVMAFAVKYNWRSVFLGMTLGIFVVHSLAVAIGSLAGELIPVHLMTIIASCLFIGFGVWTLRGDDEGEDEDEATKSSRFGPLLTVAMTFIIGEMGDKTQFAAMTMATQYESWWLVLCGAVLGMVLADSLGIIAGTFLHRRLPAKKMRYLSAGIFLLFGVAGLLESVFQNI